LGFEPPIHAIGGGFQVLDSKNGLHYRQRVQAPFKDHHCEWQALILHFRSIAKLRDKRGVEHIPISHKGNRQEVPAGRSTPPEC
jgi:hypothetical protein